MNAAVVVTSRGASPELGRALAAAAALRPRPSRLIVHDGSSRPPEGLARRFGAELSRVADGGTPARSRNRALDLLGERRLLLLDGDAAPRPDALARLLECAVRRGAAIVLPRVCDAQGLLQHGPARMSAVGLPRFQGWWDEQPAPDESAGWSAGGGSAMLVDRERLPAGLRFDESFGANLEDADFILRAALAGAVVAFSPDAEVLHLNPRLEAERRGRAGYPPQKLELQSRNRRRLVARCFSRSTLLLGAPLRALWEAATAAYALRHGLAREYLRGWRDTLRLLPADLAARRAIQAARARPDWELLTLRPPSLRPSTLARPRRP